MNKKQIKQRLIDIAYGAGCSWDDGDKYFHDFTLETIDQFCRGIQQARLLSSEDPIFNLGKSWCTKLEDIDELTQYVFDCQQEQSN